jgi:hypothetical protein
MCAAASQTAGAEAGRFLVTGELEVDDMERAAHTSCSGMEAASACLQQEILGLLVGKTAPQAGLADEQSGTDQY